MWLFVSIPKEKTSKNGSVEIGKFAWYFIFLGGLVHHWGRSGLLGRAPSEVCGVPVMGREGENKISEVCVVVSREGETLLDFDGWDGWDRCLYLTSTVGGEETGRVE